FGKPTRADKLVVPVVPVVPLSKSNRKCFQVHIPLPLPKQLVIFGLGEWKCSETTISVEVVVSADIQAQTIGTLSSQVRCLTWEGDWRPDIVTTAAVKGRRGVYGKLVLTVRGEDGGSVFSSTPVGRRKRPFPEQHSVTDLSGTLHQTAENEMVKTHEVKTLLVSMCHIGSINTNPSRYPNSSELGDSVCFAEIQVNKMYTGDSTAERKPAVWPPAETPGRTGIGKRGQLTWSSEDVDGLTEDEDQAAAPKKKRLRRISSREEMTAEIKKKNRGVSACPSERWSHTMCLIEPDTGVLIGGETSDQNYCEDSLWKLELDGDFWFPMNCSASGPVPPCSQGHTATYDPDTEAVYVYGGLKEGQRCSELHILSTLTWKWRLVTAKGNVPNLAYHSAAFYKKELFVFGGVQPGRSSGDKCCSNALYIFNPEFELWYQPIVEGDRPMQRFGHSATLLSQKLVIFGGRRTAAYLNDLHVLDLGFMEYAAVKSGNMPPLARGFHAALPVSDNRILVSGGCSAIGALQDVHIFNTDTNMWSSVASPLLCLLPRAGHSVIGLGCTIVPDTETQGHSGNATIKCTLLVFGGSDCSGSFYNDTIKCTVEIPGDK
ncbi:LOW QUALITY PROTEIN: rab9 effector protein with kelch motifs, partial [Embiotoca jacksoni]|uniref:LOW QUALITY PROTEIN: rab9 effector protein with kelch motifs n=1 Tax=Embiotoca jacksoni TaxID=100190 RepID=UPI003704712B